MKTLFVIVALAWTILSTQAATLYVRSTDGSDADSGATWALAKATLGGAFTASAAGDTIYVSQAHAGTSGANVTLISPGTAAAPCLVLCGNDAAEPPTALATTATISATGNSGILFNGFAYCYGISFSAGSGAGGTSAYIQFASQSTPFWWMLEACQIKLNSTATTAGIYTGSILATADDSKVELINTPISFAATAQGIFLHGPLSWRNTPTAILGTVPTVLFKINTTAPYGNASLIGVDLSALGSGTSLVDVSDNSWSRVFFQDCKLGASVSITTGAVAGQGGIEVTSVNSDSANTNYRYHKQTYQGTITQESTIVRSGGASDGTTPISRKMVTTANSKFVSPLESDPIVIWNELTSAITLTIPIITDNVTLTDAEVWVRVEYPGTAGFPKSVFIHDRAADILATPVNQTADSSTWVTTGLTTPVKQQLSVTFTPTGKGVIRARVMLARASTTMYCDPRVILQ